MSIKYAYRVDSGIVIDGIVVDGIITNAQWASDNLGGFWIDTDTPAWVGGAWDEINGFRPTSPYPSWVWNDGSCLWESPMPYPDDGQMYQWDEPTISWELVN